MQRAGSPGSYGRGRNIWWICAERVGDQPPKLIVRQAVPMGNEKSCTPEFLRVPE
jgi:hypothetical protein